MSSLSDFDPPSLSSMTKSIGIFPFKQLIYRWQKLSHNSCTYIMTEVKEEKKKKKEEKGKREEKGRKYNQEYISKIDKCNQSPPFTPVTSKVLNRGNTLQLSPRDLSTHPELGITFFSRKIEISQKIDSDKMIHRLQHIQHPC